MFWYPLEPTHSYLGSFVLEDENIILTCYLEISTYFVIQYPVDWLPSLKQFFINVPYHILVASLTLMALF